MHVRSWVILVVVSVCGLGAAADTELTVMSFNLRYATASDGANAWPKRKEVLVNAIKYCAPDIVGVQECLLIQAEYIAEALPTYHWFGIGREADGGGEMTAVFYRKKLLNPIEASSFWVSETPDVPGSMSWQTACTRMVTSVRFWHRKTGVFFHVFNTHLDHKSKEARERGAELIAARANQLPDGAPVIVTGDFNAKAERSLPWQTFVDSGFSDAWVVAEKRVGPEVTSSRFQAPRPDVKSRIDWILVRGPITVHECETVIYNEDGRYPSDHYPVLANLTIAE